MGSECGGMRIEWISVPTDTGQLERSPDGPVFGAVLLFHGDTMNSCAGAARFLPPALLMPRHQLVHMSTKSRQNRQNPRIAASVARVSWPLVSLPPISTIDVWPSAAAAPRSTKPPMHPSSMET